jgi:hypothetical protein
MKPATQILTETIDCLTSGTGEKSKAKDLVDTLIQVEKNTKQDRIDIPIESLTGEWQLAFATGAKKAKHRGGIELGTGYYFPTFIPAQISFTADNSDPMCGTIANQVSVGLVKLKLTGPYRYLGRKNLLAFDFLNIEVYVLGQRLYRGQMPNRPNRDENDFAQKSIGQLPFFSFIHAEDRGIVARGRGGGLALWVKS